MAGAVPNVSRRAAISASAAALVLILACGPSQLAQPSAATPANQASGPTLDAQPNPVSAGSDLGTTTVTWGSGDGSNAEVYVSENGGPETLFAAGPSGSQDANWIRAGSTYDFRLYAAADRKTLLRSVKVTRAT
jgi:hypothetical protein